MRNQIDVSRNNRIPMRALPQLDELLERAFKNPFSLFDEVQPRSMLSYETSQPAFDFYESDDAYLLSIDIPGVKREDVTIELNENLLKVSGERKRADARQMSESHSMARSVDRFERTFSVPKTVDAEKVEAHVEDGVLRVALPKSQQTKPRSIEVQSGKSGFFSKLIGLDKKEDTQSNQLKN